MNLAERGYFEVNGALADDATVAARDRKRAPDHDAGMRQARTLMGAARARLPWGCTDLTPAARFASVDDDVEAELMAMKRIDRDRVEAIARDTQRTYDQVLARRRRLRAWVLQWRALAEDPGAPAPRMPYGWR